MALMTGRSAFLDIVKQEGVSYLFGNPGTTELPIMDALVDGASALWGSHSWVPVERTPGPPTSPTNLIWPRWRLRPRSLQMR